MDYKEIFKKFKATLHYEMGVTRIKDAYCVSFKNADLIRNALDAAGVTYKTCSFYNICIIFRVWPHD